MSLIGPRPLLVQYLPLYSEKQKHRHDVTVMTCNEIFDPGHPDTFGEPV